MGRHTAEAGILWRQVPSDENGGGAHWMIAEEPSPSRQQQQQQQQEQKVRGRGWVDWRCKKSAGKEVVKKPE